MIVLFSVGDRVRFNPEESVGASFLARVQSVDSGGLLTIETEEPVSGEHVFHVMPQELEHEVEDIVP